MHEHLLLNNPDNVKLRQRQAELALRIGRFASAETQLKILRRRTSETARVWYLSGVVAEHLERPADAILYFRQANKLNAFDPETSERLAGLLTRHEYRPADAEILLNELIRNNPSARARSVRAAWLLSQDRPADAERDLWAGLSDDPADLRLLGMLVSLPKTNPPDTARLLDHLERQLAAQPDSALLRIYCAHAQWQAGHQNTAIDILRDGVARNPREMRFKESLVDFYAGRGDADVAREVLAQIPRSSVNHATWHFLMGRIDMADGDWSAAEDHFEKATGFAGYDLTMQSRAQMCLGICRREAGQRDGAVDAFRSLVRTNPKSAGGRLGMAAAWLEAGETDLAIAEYRRLLDHEGVPALLASLLIQEAEKQPEGRRNWREVERLLRDKQPAIEDRIQRTLLQAELLFANGLPAQAIRHLDHAAERWPDHPSIQQTTQGLLTSRGTQLADRLRAGIQRQPGNVEMHSALLRVVAENEGAAKAIEWMDEFVSSRASSGLPQSVRRHVVAQAAEAAAVALHRQHNSQSEALLDASRNVWQQLVEQSTQHLPDAIGFLARYRDPDSVRTAIAGLSPTLTVDVRADCWLEALRNTPHQDSLRDAAENALRALIEEAPSNMTLWLAYADYLTRFERYDAALMLHRQAIDRDPKYELAHRQAAWVLAVSNGDIQEALTLSEAAVRLSPFHPDVLAVRGLVLASSGDATNALSVFAAIPEERRSDVSRVYEALAHVHSGELAVARALLADVHRTDAVSRWYPADRRLLESILSQTADSSSLLPDAQTALSD